jgi:hypothetical protein
VSSVSSMQSASAQGHGIPEDDDAVHGEILSVAEPKTRMFGGKKLCYSRTESEDAEWVYRTVLVVFWPRSDTRMRFNFHNIDNAVAEAKKHARAQDTVAAMHCLHMIVQQNVHTCPSLELLGEMMHTCAMIGMQALGLARYLITWVTNLSSRQTGYFNPAAQVSPPILSLCTAFGWENIELSLHELASRVSLSSGIYQQIVSLFGSPVVLDRAPGLMYTVIARLYNTDKSVSGLTECFHSLIPILIREERLFQYVQALAERIRDLESCSSVVTCLAEAACLSQLRTSTATSLQPISMQNGHQEQSVPQQQNLVVESSQPACTARQALRIFVSAAMESRNAFRPYNYGSLYTTLTLCVLACEDIDMATKLVDLAMGITTLSEKIQVLSNILRTMFAFEVFQGDVLSCVVDSIHVGAQGLSVHDLLALITDLYTKPQWTVKCMSGSADMHKLVGGAYKIRNRQENDQILATCLERVITRALDVTPCPITCIDALDVLCMLCSLTTASPGVCTLVLKLSSIACDKFEQHQLTDIDMTKNIGPKGKFPNFKTYNVVPEASLIFSAGKAAHTLIQLCVFSERHNLNTASACLEKWSNLSGHRLCVLLLALDTQLPALNQPKPLPLVSASSDILWDSEESDDDEFYSGYGRGNGVVGRRSSSNAHLLACFEKSEYNAKISSLPYCKHPTIHDAVSQSVLRVRREGDDEHAMRTDKHVAEKHATVCMTRIMQGFNQTKILAVVQEELPYLAKLIVERKRSVSGTENVLSAMAALLPGYDAKLRDEICKAIFQGCSYESLHAADCHALRKLASCLALRLQRTIAKNPCPPRTDFSFPAAKYTREDDVQRFLVGQEREYVTTFDCAHDVCDLLEGNIDYSLLVKNKLALLWEVTRTEEGKQFRFTKLFRTKEDEERRRHESRRDRLRKLLTLFPSICATKAQQASATQLTNVRGGSMSSAQYMSTSHATSLVSNAQIASASSSSLLQGSTSHFSSSHANVVSPVQGGHATQQAVLQQQLQLQGQVATSAAPATQGAAMLQQLWQLYLQDAQRQLQLQGQAATSTVPLVQSQLQGQAATSAVPFVQSQLQGQAATTATSLASSVQVHNGSVNGSMSVGARKHAETAPEDSDTSTAAKRHKPD